MGTLKELETKLLDRGIDSEVRRAIHNSKICIIDDKVEQLKSLTEGLKKEGYTHLITKSRVDSVNDLIESGFDLIILDLANVASDIDTNDGLGILDKLKTNDPSLPVLVVTGTKPSPEYLGTLNKANLTRSKPVKSADLAADVEEILKVQKDPFWAGYFILKELNTINNQLETELGYFEKNRLKKLKTKLTKKLEREDSTIITPIRKVADLLVRFGPITISIIRIAKGI